MKFHEHPQKENGGEGIPDIRPYVHFRTDRSRGAGGQNVNKVETKAVAILKLESCTLFSEEQLERILKRLQNRINQRGELRVSCEETRSQLENKKRALRKMVKLIREALQEEKERIPTKPTRASREKRLREKRKRSEKKKNRRKNWE